MTSVQPQRRATPRAANKRKREFSAMRILPRPIGALILIAVALCCIPGTLVYVAGVVRFAMTPEERSALFGFLLPASRAR